MSIAQKIRDFFWNPNATWRSLAIIASTLVFVFAMIMLAING